MDSEIIHEFIELAKCLNFTETARRMNISQPALSKHIGAFERELHLTLFDRSSNPLQLTQEASELLPFAFKIAEAQQQFQARAKELRTSARQPQLFVAGLLNEDVVANILGRVLSQLRDTYGNNFLQVRHCQHKLPLRFLSGNSGSSDFADIVFDYGFEEDYADDPLVEAQLIGVYPWFALVGKEHPLANRESVKLDELRDETFVRIEGAHLSEAWRFIEDACLRRNFRPKTVKQYSMLSTDLLSSAANLNDNVLVMGDNFTRRMGIGLSPFCSQIPIVDEDAVFPVVALSRMDNANPILDDALPIIREEALRTLGEKPSNEPGNEI